jgi:hypothetical protein
MKNKIIIVFLIVLVVVSLVRISKYIYSKHLEENKVEKNNIEQVVKKEDIIIFLVENVDYLKDIYDLEIVEKKENILLIKFLDNSDGDVYFMGKIKIEGGVIEIVEDIYSVEKDFEGEQDFCAPNCSY